MKKLSFFSAALLLAAVFSAGCSKDRKPSVKPTPDKDAPVEILLSGGVVPATSAEVRTAQLPPLTRAVINAEHGALEVSFARLDQLDDGQYPAYATLSAALPATLAANTGEVSSEAAISFATSQYYLSRETNNNTKLVGWYPRAVPAAGVVTLNIDGGTDIMLTQELVGCKVAESRFGTTGKVFTFAHQLTQFRFKAYAADAAAPAVWGKITDIALKDRQTKCKITLPGTVEFEGVAADLSLSKNRLADDADIAYPLAFTEGSDTAAECGYAMVAPVAAGASLSLAVVTEQGGTCEVALPVPDAGFEKGKAYDVVLKFTTTAVEPVATIGAWVDASDRVEIPL
ncbi:fimbrillin family protein [Alistipes senegalensis]|uniref:Fimbrillin family protein n=1 Tax=Alistipes senegalensis JC50 TaxID=1033732 RepID=A0ABY5V8I4_9BACT|nr:fimbrillin family protein [Alistipes senegalensis]UEA86471.1 fimbrillin family protein [Alistipes senegalensis]UWN65940.1 fimbrillin family protein [Alistipes senegalensis JC50]